MHINWGYPDELNSAKKENVCENFLVAREPMTESLVGMIITIGTKSNHICRNNMLGNFTR